MHVRYTVMSVRGRTWISAPPTLLPESTERTILLPRAAFDGGRPLALHGSVRRTGECRALVMDYRPLLRSIAVQEAR
jgi:hypothetical protein